MEPIKSFFKPRTKYEYYRDDYRIVSKICRYGVLVFYVIGFILLVVMRSNDTLMAQIGSGVSLAIASVAFFIGIKIRDKDEHEKKLANKG